MTETPLNCDRALWNRDRALLSLDRTLLSRDREGAVPSLTHKHCHRFTLPLNDISNRRSNIIPIPQPSSAAMSCPTFSVVRAYSMIQPSARVCLERIHCYFWFDLCFDHDMHMRHPEMRCQQRPATNRTHFADRIQHCQAGHRIHHEDRLLHEIPLPGRTSYIGFECTMSRNTVIPIHGTRFVAMHMSAVAGERDQVGHASLLYTAPSRSRLSREQSRLSSAPSRPSSAPSRLSRIRSRRGMLCQTKNIPFTF